MNRSDIPAHLQNQIKYHVVADDDPNLELVASSVTIQNQGNTRAIIDDHWVLDPEDSLPLGTEVGAIVHSFSIKFVALAIPRALDIPRVVAGNRLVFCLIRRKKYV